MAAKCVASIMFVVVLDIIWLCQDPHFVFKGTEDMVDEYHNYWAADYEDWGTMELFKFVNKHGVPKLGL